MKQKTFAQMQGEDLWADLVGVGQIGSTTSAANPWHNDIRIFTVADGMRIENDLPTHDCMRLARYFIDRRPQDLGIVAMEAQAIDLDAVPWMTIYPGEGAPYTRAVEDACGDDPNARLALIFKIR